MMTIDFGRQNGQIRALNGANLGPRLYGSASPARERILAMYRALNLPMTRFHDAPLDNPGMRLVDPNLIFANFHADADDPRNYYFRQTDDYLGICRDYDRAIDQGIELHYRLGPSIEHSADHYFIYPPEDYEQWVKICTNIIRHYNEGWNNGFAWDIRYWTIWEEPCQKRLWDGDPIAFYRLFELAVRRLKARFPNIKLGTDVNHCMALARGDDPSSWVYETKWVADYLAYCRDEKVPLDFFACSSYSGDPDQTIAFPAMFKRVLDDYGFVDTEFHIGEWNYSGVGVGWASEGPRGRLGPDGAAYIAAVLTGWQDSPLTMANYYTISHIVGVFHHTDDGDSIPGKNYFGLVAFGEMTRFDRRVAAKSEAKGVWCLAGVNDAGEGAILVSVFKPEMTRLVLRIQGATAETLTVRCVNAASDLELIEFERTADGLVIPHLSGSSVLRIDGYRRAP